ncbi:MAG: hypothetical protein V8S96_08630 [Lachnospiraceae bacterium]
MDGSTCHLPSYETLISSTDAKRNACANGARDLNCSDDDAEMLESGGLYADFEGLGEVMDRVAEKYVGKTVEITTPLGTHITADITGRKNLPQYGRSIVPGQSSSRPTLTVQSAQMSEPWKA